MNERVRELAKKAGITFKPMIVDSVEYEYRHVHLNDYTNGIDEATCIEQFAELIVRESIEDCRDMFMVDSVSWNLLNEKLEHFGVE